MNLDVVKSSLGKIDIEKAKLLFQNAAVVIKEKKSQISKFLNIRIFLQAIAAVISIYAILFLYVYMVTSSTIKSIEEKLGSETVVISTTTENHGSPDHNEDEEEALQQQQMPKPVKSAAAIDGLYEEKSIGFLPIVRASDSLTSFEAYKSPFSFEGLPPKPIISFVVMDYGLSQQQSNTALDILPPSVSLILSPYAKLPEEWVRRAQEKGHEVWIDLPIQNNKATDQGQFTLFHHNSFRQKQRSLHNVLAATQGYVGVSIFADEGTVTEQETYIKLQEELYERGLGLLQRNPNAPYFFFGKSVADSAPYIQADHHLIHISSNQNSYDQLEETAKQKGYVIGVIPNYPQAIKNLAVWIEKVARADYILAPASAMYDAPRYVAARQNKNTLTTPGTLNPDDKN
ncbi:MAG: hypothetical protein GC137_10140 [Alphaproteobacteria bacterium]|nr:hypothetical protein [Alphaproteobacteria bacterium]